MASFLVRNNYLAAECLVFVKFCGYTVSAIAYSMLVQDKICLWQYNQTVAYCQHLDAVNLEATDVRDHILADSSKFATYRNLIEFLPMFVWSLLVGSFLDRHRSATRILLVLSSIGDLLVFLSVLVNIYFYHWSPYMLLLSSLQLLFTGGMVSFLTTIYRYIAVTVEDTQRPIKFALFEAAVILGLSLGNFIGGQLLKLKSTDADHPRTYGRNYLLSIFMSLISFALVFALKQAPLETEKTDERDDDEVDEMNNLQQQRAPMVRPKNVRSVQGMNYLREDDQIEDDGPRARVASFTGSVNALLSEEMEYIREESRTIAVKFFSLANVLDTVACLTRARPHRARTTILVLFFVQMIQVLVFLGIETVSLQFSEKVYHWDARSFSTFSASSKILATLFMTIWVVLFVKKFKVSERKLIKLGLLSACLSQTLLGTFLAPVTYLLAIPIGSFGGLISIAIRSMVSSIVEPNEIGKIFSLMTTLESSLPLLSALIYTALFSASITYLPGLIYQFSGLLFLLTFVVYIGEEFYSQQQVDVDQEAVGPPRDNAGPG